MTDTDDDGLLVARLSIERRLHDDGSDAVWFEATDGDGDQLGLVETLGLLEMSKDTAIRLAMHDDDDGEQR